MEPSPTNPSGSVGLAPTGGPPFDAAFFASVFVERITAICREQPEGIPVVELHLADGSLLDLCHITQLSGQWIGVMAYRDTETCAVMDLEFVPYGLITRLTVSARHPHQRRIGFDLEKSLDATASRADP